MMKCLNVFFAFTILFLSVSCNSKQEGKPVNIGKIYTAKKQRDTFVVDFTRIADSVFLSYYFIFKDGNYLNFPTESLDNYAGFFTIDSVRNRRVTFPIKDYRQYWYDSSKVYDLTLNFLSDSTFHWYIDSIRYGILDFLPHDVIFLKKE
jgi:hypothetical protein